VLHEHSLKTPAAALSRVPWRVGKNALLEACPSLAEALNELPNPLVDIDAELSNARIRQGKLRDCIGCHRELAETENTDAELRDVDDSGTKLSY
jgi:hypothetical protein